MTQQKPVQPKNAYLIVDKRGKYDVPYDVYTRKPDLSTVRGYNRNFPDRAPHRVIKVEIREIPSP